MEDCLWTWSSGGLGFFRCDLGDAPTSNLSTNFRISFLRVGLLDSVTNGSSAMIWEMRHDVQQEAKIVPVRTRLYVTICPTCTELTHPPHRLPQLFPRNAPASIVINHLPPPERRCTVINHLPPPLSDVVLVFETNFGCDGRCYCIFPVILSENRQVKIKLTDSMTPRSSEETPSHRFRGQSTKYFIIRYGGSVMVQGQPWTNNVMDLLRPDVQLCVPAEKQTA